MFQLFSVALFFIIAIIAPAHATVPPWMLGDEQQVMCWFLNKTEISTPPGLSLAWVSAPGEDVTSDMVDSLEYNVKLDQSFWSATTTQQLLGGTLGKWQSLCTNESNTACTTSSSSNCCVYHSNIHSCRAETGVCEPWVTPQNCTGGSCDAGSVLVTHTSSQVGGPESYFHDVGLSEGNWIIIAHIKIMNFQCAVGASRTIRAPSSTANTGLVIGLVVGFGVILVIVVSVFFWLHSKTSEAVRDTKFAPKEAPLALIFTDIQDSTKLWGDVTMSMSNSLDAHHEIIRKCLRNYQGYEVKTVGDSFMIAVKDPKNAVKIACEVQEELQNHAWPLCITNLYDDLPVDDEPEDCRKLDTPFNGLRVRIGIHFGEPTVAYDEIAMGYDYYGPDVNVAARIESVGSGGQIVVSEAIRNACQTECASFCNFKSVGEATLKGVKAPMELYQCTPNSLAHRVFKEPLRSNTVQADDDGESEGSTADGPLSGDAQSQTASRQGDYFDAKTIFNHRHPLVESGDITVEALRRLYIQRQATYDALLKPFKPAAREKLVKDLCEGWRVDYRKGRYDRNIALIISRALSIEKPKDGTALQNSICLVNSGSFAGGSPLKHIPTASSFHKVSSPSHGNVLPNVPDQ